MTGAALSARGTVDSYRVGDMAYANFDPMAGAMQQRAIRGASWTGFRGDD